MTARMDLFCGRVIIYIERREEFRVSVHACGIETPSAANIRTWIPYILQPGTQVRRTFCAGGGGRFDFMELVPLPHTSATA
jgi:hypothetical protein